MTETIIVSVISLIGTLGGSLGGILVANKLTNYRVEQLEKKVEKHNSVVERTFKLEGRMTEAEHDIRDLKSKGGIKIMKEAGITFIKNIANLFKVKTILSLCVIITTCVLTFKGIISVEAFMAIASAIITYYFTRTEKKEEQNSELQ